MLVGGAAIVIALAWTGIGRMTPAAVGSALFTLLAWGAFIICMLEGVRTAADALARERREGTLGLLFLTSLSGKDVVLGKFWTIAIGTFSMVVAALPAFAFPVMLGGVTWAESGRLSIVLLKTALFALSAGLLISAFSSSALASMAGTIVLLFSLTVAPLLVVWMISGAAFGRSGLLWLGGPLGMLMSTRELDFYRAPSGFVAGAIYSIALSATMLGIASVSVRRRPEPRTTSSSWWRRLIHSNTPQRKPWTGEPKQLPAAIWMAERALPGRRILWILVTAGALGCFLAALFGSGAVLAVIPGVQILFGISIKLWMAMLAPQSIAAARQSGALELLLCTPLTPGMIVRGHVEAFREYFMVPALFIALVLPLGATAGGWITSNNDALEGGLLMVPVGLGWLFFFLLDVHALAYAGLWFGLTTAKIEGAIGRTVFYVLIVPWLTAIVPLLGALGMLFWPGFWIWWASRRLERELRIQAANQHQPLLGTAR